VAFPANDANGMAHAMVRLVMDGMLREGLAHSGSATKIPHQQVANLRASIGKIWAPRGANSGFRL
jgi:hypothetical protein